MKFLTGTVYSKALAIFLAAALGLLGAAAALTQIIILREFERSEQREMAAMLQRFSLVMARETLPMEAALGEWSRVRKTTDAGGAGGGLAELLAARSGKDNVDFVLLFDGNTGTFETIHASPVAVPELDAILTQLGSQRIQTTLRKADHQSGFIAVNGNLCAISAIALRDDKGKPKPTWLIGGHLFQKESWGFLEGLFSAAISFHPLQGALVSDPTGRDLVELLNQRAVVIKASGSSQITGYRLIKALDDSPLGYVSISQARPLLQEGLRAVQIFLTGICLAGGALVAVVWILLDRTILARIKDLTRKLEAEKRSGRLPVRLDFRGDDELGLLARGIEDLAVQLESTRSLYRTVLEDQTELICRFDGEFRLTFANAIFYRMFEIGDDPQAHLLAEILPPEAWKDFLAQFNQLSREKPLLTHTHSIRIEPHAPPVWFRSTLRRTFDADGRVSGGQWVLADISAQVSAQRRMIESERRFRRLFESASDGLLVLEGESHVVSDINSSLCRMLMLPGSSLLGRSLKTLPTFAPCLDAVEEFHRQGGGATIRRECRLARADETSVFIELRCGGYEGDGVTYLQLSFRNISERVLGEQELRRLSAKLLRLQDEERRRIARDLHDSTAQSLSALEMNMSLLAPLVENFHPRAVRLVADTRQIASECSKELRNISYLLHPPLLDEVGLIFAIKWFVDGFSKRTGITTTLEIDEGIPRLSPELEMPLFRVVQEALTNIYRHSGADHAWVRLERTSHFLILEVRDNGRGFGEDIQNSEKDSSVLMTGVGLPGIKERLANVGGTLEIESSPLGATLTIRVPLGRND